MDITRLTIDPTDCAQEPIHTPGSIQPHGIMLIGEQNGFVVRQVAGDVEQRLGLADWQGRNLNALIGESLTGKVAALVRSQSAAGYIGQLQASNGELLDVSAYLSADYVVVELEPASLEAPSASLMLEQLSAAVAGFERMVSVGSLCDAAAVEFRRLTGFDRVMVYQFLDTDTGDVVAESRRADMHSFLHHRFPASDIPRQARALYIRTPVRVIPDATYQPDLLRPDCATPVPPLNMSDSCLRSVSPVHLRYLSNMNVRASASVSIIRDGRLWGLIACHHDTPRLLTYDVRAACRTLAYAMAREISAKEGAEGYRQRARLRSFEDDVVRLLSVEGAVAKTLSHHRYELRRMMAADGVAILRGNELVTDGACPTESEVRDLAAWLPIGTAQTTFSTANLSMVYPPAADFKYAGSGLLATILSVEDQWLLLWFRTERIEIVKWAGNPHEPHNADASQQLWPRASFESWPQIVGGHAREWTPPEIDAVVRLRVALLDVWRTQRVHELNRQLTKILQDKDLLLQQNAFLIGEVNHRVQNSLHLVSSYLALQARASDNPELLAPLEEARRRISAVAVVHRRLYRDGQVAIVDAARYIEELCSDTFAFMGQDWARHLTLNLIPVMVSTSRAVTLGLLITELIINANKHAYGGVAGPIEIELIEEGSQLSLIVSDKGSGKVAYSLGFGSRIVEGLAAQLRGKITYHDNHPGLRTVITMAVE